MRHIADLTMARQWDYGAVPRLAAVWGCTDRSVRSYAAAAAVALSLDRGTLEQLKAASLAETAHIRDLALDGEEPDLKAALQAQQHLDRIRGVLQPSSPMVQVNVNTREQDENLETLWVRVMDALADIPGAVERASAVIATVMRERRRAVGADTIDTIGEAVV